MTTTTRDFTTINGSAATCGRMLGELWAQTLRKRVAATRRLQKRHHIPDSELSARVRDFRKILRAVAPHWLREAAAICKAAGISTDELLMLNCLPPDFHTRAGAECTSFLSVGRERNLLFKIRDERNHIQAFYVRDLPHHGRVQAAHDIGNLGVAHFLNSRGLAGANDTGSRTRLVTDDVRLNDCHILRYFAENAKSVSEIPRLYERLVDGGYAGGAGLERGAIYIFVDPDQGLILETVPTECVATFVNKGVRAVSNHFLTPRARQWMSLAPDKNTLLRKKRMDELLVHRNNQPTPAAVFRFSRDRKYLPHALCNDDRVHHWMTISAQLHVIDRHAPGRSMNFACCGNTRHSLFLPVPLSMTASYVPLASGAFYRAADKLYRQHQCSTHMHALQREFESRILSAANNMTAQDAHDFCRQAYRILRGSSSR